MSYRILAYHTVGRYDELLPSGIGTSPEDFEQQLDWLLASGYRVVPLADVLSALARGAAPHARDVAITFDDGYADCLRYAMPELTERKLPATFFVSPGLLGQSVTMGSLKLDMLAPTDVTQLAEIPGITIGSHGMNHVSLAGLPAPALAAELAASRRALEDLTGRPVSWLSYPFGGFDSTVAAAARAAGYLDALSVWTRAEGPFARLRIPVHTHDGSWRFAFKLSRYYFPLKRWLKR